MAEIKKLLINKKGLTLIELVVSVVLLAVIITSAVSFYVFGTRSFTDGEKRAGVQRNVRLVSEIIANELRNTTNLYILSKASAAPAGCNKGFSISGTTFTRFGSTNNQNIEMISNVKFTVYDKSGRAMVRYIITGASAAQQFQIDKEILLNNLLAADLQGKLVLGQEYSLTDYKFHYYKP